jgi:hypothetical protein
VSVTVGDTCNVYGLSVPPFGLSVSWFPTVPGRTPPSFVPRLEKDTVRPPFSPRLRINRSLEVERSLSSHLVYVSASTARRVDSRLRCRFFSMSGNRRSILLRWGVIGMFCIVFRSDVSSGLVTASKTPSAQQHHVQVHQRPFQINHEQICYQRRVQRWVGRALKDKSALSSSHIMESGSDDGVIGNNRIAADVEAASVRNSLRMACAKMAVISASVDLLLEGKDILAGKRGAWLLSLKTLWKFSFSYHIWRISRLHNQVQDVDTFTRGVEGILRTMTAVWRQTGIVVTLLILEEAAFAWRDKIPFVRHILTTLLGGAMLAVLYLSRKEILSLSLASCTGDRAHETPRQRISRHGRVTLRAMSVCSAAFCLEGALIGFIALSQSSWPAFFGKLLSIPTPVGLGTILWEMRKAFGPVLKQLSEEDNTRMSVTPQASIDLNTSTELFWTKAKGTLFLETVLKVAAAAIAVLPVELLKP